MFQNLLEKQKIEKLIVVFFFLAVSIYYILPITDVDFPWHLKTGEYIVQHMEIPKIDPFSVFSSGSMSEAFIMTQYWLAQILFYLIYRLGGTLGITIFKSIVFTGITAILWISMKNTSTILKIVVLSGASILFISYANDRPQYFSFLGAAIVILLLMNYKRTSHIRYLLFLPLLMLLWSNMHGGFIFGDVVIAIFCFSETLKYFFSGNSRPAEPKMGIKLLVLGFAGLISILISYLNPNTYYAFIFGFESTVSGAASGIMEYMSPIAEMRNAYITKRIFIYWAAVGYCLVRLALNLKKIDLTHLALVLFALALSLQASRFIPFFVITGIMVSGQYGLRMVKDAKSSVLSNLKIVSEIATLLLVIACGSYIVHSRPTLKALTELPETALFPARAAQFLQDNVEGGNIFCSRNNGSYLLWRLYPKFRTFIDTRGLNPRVAQDYTTIAFAAAKEGNSGLQMQLSSLNELLRDNLAHKKLQKDKGISRTAEKEKWAELLTSYNMNIIIHEATNFFSGYIYPLALKLIRDDEWALVYQDGRVFIFVRDIPRFRNLIAKFGLEKNKVYDEIGMENAGKAGSSIHAPAYSSLAFALAMKNGPDTVINQYMKHAYYLNANDTQTVLIGAFLQIRKEQKQAITVSKVHQK